MSSALLLLIVVLLIGGLVFLVQACRHKEPPFKPLARLEFDEAIPRLGGRRRAGPVCFVTGMSRAACACTGCQRGRGGR